MANHEIVPTSAFTKGTAERKKSATSFSFPGFASSGTYSANFVITFSCFDSRLTRGGGVELGYHRKVICGQPGCYPAEFMLIIDAMDFRGVDLNLLVCLRVLLVERHVTRSAGRLGVTQPAMSA